jgi:hypothetical protein
VVYCIYGGKAVVAQANIELVKQLDFWNLLFLCSCVYLHPVFLTLSSVWGNKVTFTKSLLGHHLCCHPTSEQGSRHGEWALSEAAPARKQLFFGDFNVTSYKTDELEKGCHFYQGAQIQGSPKSTVEDISKVCDLRILLFLNYFFYWIVTLCDPFYMHEPHFHVAPNSVNNF